MTDFSKISSQSKIIISASILALLIVAWRLSRLMSNVEQAHQEFSQGLQDLAAQKLIEQKQEAYQQCRHNLSTRTQAVEAIYGDACQELLK